MLSLTLLLVLMFFSLFSIVITSLGEERADLYASHAFEPRHDKMCLREFPTRSGTNRPAQPQKLARVLKFRL